MLKIEAIYKYTIEITVACEMNLNCTCGEPKDEEKSRLNCAVFILDFLELLITFHGAKWESHTNC